MGSYVPTTAAEREEMLAAIGVKSLEDLYQAVPQGMLLNGTLNIPEGMSELEVREAVTAMAEKNKVCFSLGSFGNKRLMSWINPISSIRSASSNTKYWIVSKCICP